MHSLQFVCAYKCFTNANMNTLFSPLNPPALLKAGMTNYWQHLAGCAAGLAIQSLLIKEQAPIIIVCSEAQHLHKWQRELQFFNEKTQILRFSDWECLPYDRFSPHQDIISERLLSLYQLPNLQSGILLTTVSALSHKLAPTEYVQNNAMNFKVGDELDIPAFTQQLINAGYYSVGQVMSPGEYAIENIKLFDPETQLSIETVNEIRLLPAREFPLDDKGIEKFRQQFRQTFEGDPQKTVIYPEISKGIAPAGAEYFLPLFFEQSATLLDYAPENSIFVFEDQAQLKFDEFQKETQQRFDSLSHDIEWPLMSPDAIFVQPDQLRQPTLEGCKE